MAEFCTKCTKRLGFSVTDIEAYRIFERLKAGEMIDTDLCEGCGLIAVMKDDDGYLQVGHFES